MRTDYRPKVSPRGGLSFGGYRPFLGDKRRPWQNHTQDKYHRYIINDRIQTPSMRLIDDKGKQIGILSRQEAFNIAQEKQLDLVLITNHVQPPVVKLIEFNKFLYQENKKQKEAKKGSKKSDIKDIKLSLFIGRGDLERLVKKAQEFLEKGHQVRIGLLLKGREIGKKQMGFDLINQYISAVGDVIISHLPKMQGRVIITVIGRKKTRMSAEKI